MATLEAVRTPQRMPRDSLPLLKGTTVIGRDPKSDIELAWDGMSRVHARIYGTEPDGSGLPSKFLIVDEGGGGNNGTFVNGVRVQQHVLADGDVIGFGKGRNVPRGGDILDKNLEYLFLFRPVKTKAQVNKGKLAAGMAESGAHRHLRGPSRHPLKGHSVAGQQKEKRIAHKENHPGELVPPCKAMLYAPSDYVPSKNDHRGPASDLQLEFVHGYRGQDVMDNLFYVDENTIIYPAGSLVVKLDITTNTQSFFYDHDDDVVALCIDSKERNFVASGQVAQRTRRSEDGRPSATVMVWDQRYMRRNVEGWSGRGVMSRIHMHKIHALDFDPSCKFLVTYGGDQNNNCSICVYEWRKSKVWFKIPAGCSIVNTVKHNPSNPMEFVQCSDRNMRVWDYEKAQQAPEQAYTVAAMQNYTGGRPCSVNCVTFMDDGTSSVAAMQTGALFVFGVKGHEITVIASVPDEDRGGKVAHDGQALFVLWHKRVGLLSSGQDGFVRIWELDWQGSRFRKPPRMIKQVSLRPFALRGFQKYIAAHSMDISWNESANSGKVLLGTTTNGIFEIDLTKMANSEHDVQHECVRIVHQGHCGESRRDPRTGNVLPSLAITAVATFPAPKADLFATVAEDSSLRIWHTRLRRIERLRAGQEAVVDMGLRGNCVDVSDDGKYIAVGHQNGSFTVWEAEKLKCLLQNNYRTNAVSCIRFSPGGRYLAVGSTEQSIDVYDVLNGYRRIGNDKSRHTSSLTHMDWSADSKYIRSNDNDASLLYWHAPVLQPFVGHTAEFRDTSWATETVAFGWDRKHIFGESWSINDTNSVCVTSKESGRASLVTGDDFGKIRLFRYPAISKEMPCRTYVGHAAHVLGVRFTQDDRFLISVGGTDLCVMQWRYIENVNRRGPEAALGGVNMRANSPR